MKHQQGKMTLLIASSDYFTQVSEPCSLVLFYNCFSAKCRVFMSGVEIRQRAASEGHSRLASVSSDQNIFIL